MPVDFTSFLLPYQPKFNSTSSSSSFDQALANKAARQRQEAENAAVMEQTRVQEAGKLERDQLKLTAEEKSELNKKRAEFSKRWSETSARGDKRALLNMAPEANMLGLTVRVDEADERELPDMSGGLGTVKMPAYSKIYLEDDEGGRYGEDTDVKAIRSDNQARVREVGEARVKTSRKEDREAEFQALITNLAAGLPLGAEPVKPEDAGSRADRESAERRARDALNVQVMQNRESNDIRREGMALADEDRDAARDIAKGRAEASQQRGDANERLKWRRDAEYVGKTEKVPELQEAMRELNQSIALLKDTERQDGKSQMVAIRKLGMSLNKGAFSDRDAEVVTQQMGVLQRLEASLSQKAWNELGDQEREAYEDTLADIAVTVEGALNRAYQNMARRAPLRNPMGMEEYNAYMDAQFRDLPAYQQSNRAPEGGNEPESLDDILREVDPGAGP